MLNSLLRWQDFLAFTWGYLFWSYKYWSVLNQWHACQIPSCIWVLEHSFLTQSHCLLALLDQLVDGAGILWLVARVNHIAILGLFPHIWFLILEHAVPSCSKTELARESWAGLRFCFRYAKLILWKIQPIETVLQVLFYFCQPLLEFSKLLLVLMHDTVTALRPVTIFFLLFLLLLFLLFLVACCFLFPWWRCLPRVITFCRCWCLRRSG